MKSITLAITLMSLLAIASLSMAFNVSVSVPGSEGSNGQQVYQTVEMQPVNSEEVQTAKQGEASGARDEALVAEKK